MEAHDEGTRWRAAGLTVTFETKLYPRIRRIVVFLVLLCATLFWVGAFRFVSLPFLIAAWVLFLQVCDSTREEKKVALYESAAPPTELRRHLYCFQLLNRALDRLLNCVLALPRLRVANLRGFFVGAMPMMPMHFVHIRCSFR